MKHEINGLTQALAKGTPDITGALVATRAGELIASGWRDGESAERIALEAARIWTSTRRLCAQGDDLAEVSMLRFSNRFVLATGVGQNAVLVAEASRGAKLGLVMLDLARTAKEIARMLDDADLAQAAPRDAARISARVGPGGHWVVEAVNEVSNLLDDGESSAARKSLCRLMKRMRDAGPIATSLRPEDAPDHDMWSGLEKLVSSADAWADFVDAEARLMETLGFAEPVVRSANKALSALCLADVENIAQAFRDEPYQRRLDWALGLSMRGICQSKDLHVEAPPEWLTKQEAGNILNRVSNKLATHVRSRPVLGVGAAIGLGFANSYGPIGVVGLETLLGLPGGLSAVSPFLNASYSVSEVLAIVAGLDTLSKD